MKLGWIALFMFFTIHLPAQETDSRRLSALNKLLKPYGNLSAGQGLYLHADKTVYQQGEDIWFTAYQLMPSDTTENTLFVVLQRAGEDTILSVSRFIMNNGTGHGNIFLEDSLKGGNYRLLAYTNTQLEYPSRNVFQLYFSLDNRYTEKYSLLRIGERKADSQYIVTYKVVLDDGRSADKGSVAYTLLSNITEVAAGTVELTEQGEMMIAVPAQYLHTTLTLRTTVRYGKDRRKVTQPLLVEPGVRVSFYPESGHLLEGVPGRVAFEIHSDTAERPVYTGQLLEDGKPVAELKTDRMGRGSFGITPSSTKRYTLSLNGTTDYAYHFPTVESEGYSMAVPADIVKDSVTAIIYAAGQRESLDLVLHNYKEVFAVQTVVFKDNIAKVTFPLNGTETLGVLALTLLDKNKKAWAERCVYYRDDNDVQVSLTPDKEQYKTRSRIRLKVAFRDSKGDPVKGLFSLGCVASSKRNSDLVTNMPLFFYAGQYLASGLRPIAGFSQEDTAAIHLMLLTDFWSRYRWHDVMTIRPSPLRYSALGLEGRFEYEKRPLKKPVNYVLVKSNGLETFATEADGTFRISYKALYDRQGQVLSLLPETKKGKYSEIGQFSLVAGFDTLNHIASYIGRNTYFPWFRSEDVEEVYSLKDKRVLKEVKIVAQKDKKESRRGIDGIDEYVSRMCTDYVCGFNVLNCPTHGHFTSNPPVKGRVYTIYLVYPDFKSMVRYMGCTDDRVAEEKAEFMTHINATWQGKEFYSYYNSDDSLQDHRESTLLWVPRTLTNNDGEAALEFFTNDLTGHFTIHLQGFSSKGPVSGTAQFFVTD